ncbi:hypothetical protein CCMA1212_005256 [Trichoderma ghanense]|uniref:Uncharacterized protein n=1 Tax=Trichoderma ghanense TaxID=65468 RepID=A0ABY2H603_9HYPO
MKIPPIQHRCSRRQLALCTRGIRILGVVVQGQARGDLEGVSDLATVPAARGAGEVLVVLCGELEDLVVLDGEGGLAGHLVALRLHDLELGDVEAEDFGGLGLVEGRVVEGEVDAGLEGLVDGADAVGRQEEEAVVVLEDAEEDGDEGVARHVLLGALREEDVGLVEQQHAVPQVGQAEDVLEPGLDLVRRQAEVAAGDDEERLLVLHGHGFGGRRLADAGDTVEEHHEAAALALDEILAGALGGGVDVAALELLLAEVGHDEAAHHVLVVAVDAEVLKDADLAADGLEEVEVDGHEAALAQGVGEHALGQQDEVLVAQLEGLGVGLEVAGAAQAVAQEGVDGEVVAALAALDAVGLLDDFLLDVGPALAGAVEPLLDGHLVLGDLAADGLADGQLVEVGPPVGHLLVGLGEVDDDVALDELGVAHLLVVLVLEYLLVGLVAVRGRVPGQRPGVVLLVAVLEVVQEAAPLLLEALDELLVAGLVAHRVAGQRVDGALAGKGLDLELVLDGAKGRAVVVDVVGRDLELCRVVDVVELVEEAPAVLGVRRLGLGRLDAVDAPDLVVAAAGLDGRGHVDEVADAEEGPQVVELDLFGRAVVEALVQRHDLLVDELDVAAHVAERLGAVHEGVKVFVGVGVHRREGLGVGLVILGIRRRRLGAVLAHGPDNDLGLLLAGGSVGALLVELLVVCPLLLQRGEDLAHLGLEVHQGLEGPHEGARGRPRLGVVEEGRQVSEDGLGLDADALDLGVGGEQLVALLALDLGDGVDLATASVVAAVEAEPALADAGRLLAAAEGALAADLALQPGAGDEDLDGVVGLVLGLEAVLEVFKVDLADLGDLGAPLGGDAAAVGEDALAPLGFLLEGHHVEVVGAVGAGGAAGAGAEAGVAGAAAGEGLSGGGLLCASHCCGCVLPVLDGEMDGMMRKGGGGEEEG